MVKMSDQTIKSQDSNVDDLFKDFYFVPDYQREFVWEEEDVRQLLEDIDRERTESETPQEYFIGSIVVCSDSEDVADDNRFQLIDGQQRMTTLFLILCALRSRLQKAGKKTPKLDGMIYSFDTDSAGEDYEKYRLELQYGDSQDVLEEIAGAEPKELQNCCQPVSVNEEYRPGIQDDSRIPYPATIP